MLCLRCSRGLSAFSGLSRATRIPQSLTTKGAAAGASKRTFTNLTPRRPTIFPSTQRSFAPPTQSLPATATTTSHTGEILDVAILPYKMSGHEAMRGMQVRCAPRNTFNPSHFVRKRRHGFLARLRSRTGRMILKRRRVKKRSTLSH
ncbi:hypothetical protein HYALB_00004964 [Hymenoscyphus albidus]|uniref:Ribosomal protein L34 n=1 Tax=Hymenoscyphus albidus TaxID=595503 RepID=A0A9N9LTX2_9HELO|nr:hypothetical protein HYALB_00004964 [Hymenoscyphus albidus]